MTAQIEHYTCEDTGMTVYARGNGWEDEDGVARNPREERRARKRRREEQRRQEVNDAAKAARAELKTLGYRALTGSKKQKDWAEGIRLDIVSRLDQSVRGEFADKEFQKADFWIENRKKHPDQFKRFLELDAEIAARAKAASDARDFYRMNEIVLERRRLHAEWKI